MGTVNHLIWQTTRSTQEVAMFLDHIGRHLQENGESAEADMFLMKSRELSQQASQFQKIAISHVSPSVENIQQPTKDQHDSDAGK